MKIGQRIKELRKRQGFTQIDLAKQIQVSESTISRYERDEIEPTITIAIKMADRLGCTLDYLALGLDDDQTESSSDISNLVNDIKNLNDKDFQAVKMVVEAFHSQKTLHIISGASS
jgi:transcriptional regulator with XRE-family HTH domain